MRRLYLLLPLLFVVLAALLPQLTAQDEKRQKLGAFDGSALTNLNASACTSGTLAYARGGIGPSAVFDATGSTNSSNGMLFVSYSGAGTYTLNRSGNRYAPDANYGVVAVGNTPVDTAAKMSSGLLYVTRAALPAFSSSTSFSWFIRIRHPETGSVYGYFAQQTSSSNLTTAVWNGGNIRAYVGSTSNYGTLNGPNLGVVSNQWYTVGAVYDGTQTGNAARLKLYLNGEPQTVTFTGTIPASLAANGGGFDVHRFYSGASYSHGSKSIATFAVWNSARTDEAMRSAHAGNYALAALCWEFPDTALASGSTVPDESGNGLTGTVAGGTFTADPIRSIPLFGCLTSRSTSAATIQFRDLNGALRNPELATAFFTY